MVNGKEWQITLPMKEIRSPWFRTSDTSQKVCSQSADDCVPFTCFLLPLAVTQQKVLCWESPRKVPNRLTYAKEPYLKASKRRLGYCKKQLMRQKAYSSILDRPTHWMILGWHKFQRQILRSVMYWECVSQATPGTSHTHLNLCPHRHIKFQIETSFMFEATNSLWSTVDNNDSMSPPKNWSWSMVFLDIQSLPPRNDAIFPAQHLMYIGRIYHVYPLFIGLNLSQLIYVKCISMVANKIFITSIIP